MKYNSAAQIQLAGLTIYQRDKGHWYAQREDVLLGPCATSDDALVAAVRWLIACHGGVDAVCEQLTEPTHPLL